MEVFKMMFDLTEGIRDGYYPDEPAGEILFQYVNYRIEIEDIKELLELRKEIEKAVRENLIIL